MIEYRVLCPNCREEFVTYLPETQVKEFMTTCLNCGHKFTFQSELTAEKQIQPVYTYTPYAPYTERESFGPLLAGIILIAVALIGMLTAPMTANVLFGLDPHRGDVRESAQFYACGIVFILFSMFALVGGTYSLQRKHFSIALVGSILGCLTIAFPLSLVALILVVVHKNDYEEFQALSQN